MGARVVDRADEATRVAAICVTFDPDLIRLKDCLQAVASQVATLFVVDNSESDQMRGLVQSVASGVGSEYRALGSNQGLAYAFNQGIEEALDHRCSHVLLLDQDSIVDEHMVAELLAAEAGLDTQGSQPIAALGPVYQDPRAERAITFARYRRFPPVRLDPATQPAVFDVDMLISSGALIPRRALEVVGLMDPGLFIDHIDTDWCLRALAAHCRLVAVKAARMEHCLGRDWVRLVGYRLPVHDAQRMYFMFRNSWLLYRRPYARWSWVAADLRRLAVVCVLHLVAGRQRGQALAMMLRGTAHGILGKTGQRPWLKAGCP